MSDEQETDRSSEAVDVTYIRTLSVVARNADGDIVGEAKQHFVPMTELVEYLIAGIDADVRERPETKQVVITVEFE